MRKLLQHVELASEHLGFLLLQHAYLQPPPPPPPLPSHAAAAASPSEKGEDLVSALIAIGAPCALLPTFGVPLGL